MELIKIDDHITAIDHDLIARPGIGATYVVQGDDIALIETGTSYTVQKTLAGLEYLGIRREAVGHILCTHVHMDHAGGAGYLAAVLPNASVYIHRMTGQHLVDPSRLLPSVRRAVGEDAWPYHGDIKPIDADRLKPAEDLRLDLGNDVILQAVPTPGHSADHIAYHELKSGGMFIGDGASVSMSRLDLTFPVAPPPGYDLAQHKATVQMLRGLDISRFYITHFGAYNDVPGLLNLTDEKLDELHGMVQKALAAESVDVAGIARRWLPYNPTDPDSLIARSWGEMSVNGMLRYERKRMEK
ncbi:MAG: MBL fold metallo-hydrolase [Chloroflexaceae bacterium]|nr:MBL fold metallo-hydrolase [Chloroflexaceae bacterium]NJL34416.1 MBL fold metallo-hydrolase [Chloroflexaceae bacterium]NJO06562.1 MBL fold metallo-hydrolase [Chloroflexaceae bacterium]